MCTVKSTISTKHKIIENVVVRIIGVPDNWRADNRRTCTALRNAFCHLPTNFVARRNSKQTAVLGPGPNTSVEVAATLCRDSTTEVIMILSLRGPRKIHNIRSETYGVGRVVSPRRRSVVGGRCTMHNAHGPRASFLSKRKNSTTANPPPPLHPHQLSLSDRRPPPTAAEPLPCRVVDHCRDRHHQLCHRLTRPCVVFFPCYFRLVFFFFLSFYYRAITHLNNTEVTDCQQCLRRSSPTVGRTQLRCTREFRINSVYCPAHYNINNNNIKPRYLYLVPSRLAQTYGPYYYNIVHVNECASVFRWLVRGRLVNTAISVPYSLVVRGALSIILMTSGALLEVCPSDSVLLLHSCSTLLIKSLLSATATCIAYTGHM